MTSRADIAQALSDTGLVKASTFRPSVLGSGNAWPQVTGHARQGGFLATSWAVFVILPADAQTAAAWYDEHIAELWAALLPVIYVDADQAVSVTVNGTDSLYAIELTGHSE